MTSQKAYSCILFSDENGRESGRVYVQGNNLVFQSDTQTLEFPLSRVNMKIGGTGKRHVYISHPDMSGITLFTSDFSLLREPGLQGHTHAREAVQNRRAYLGIFIAPLALLAIVVYLLFINRSLLSGFVIQAVPVSADRELGELVFKDGLQQDMLTNKNESLRTKLDQLSKPFSQVSDNSPYRLQFHIGPKDTVNARALPGGHIILNKGLIMAADSPLEIQGVMAHEIAHVTKRHSMRAFIGAVSTWMFLGVFVGSADIAGPEMIAEYAAEFANKKYSRTQELNADRIGAKYLQRAGLSPIGLIRFLKTVQEKKAKGFEIPLLRTHPAIDTRIQQLKKQLPEDTQRPVAENQYFNLKAFQNKLEE